MRSTSRTLAGASSTYSTTDRGARLRLLLSVVRADDLASFHARRPRAQLSEKVVLLTSFGVHRGIAGAWESFRLLDEQMPRGRSTYHTMMAERETGFLEWTGEADDGARVTDGADSYLIRDGRTRAMAMHYMVLPPS